MKHLVSISLVAAALLVAAPASADPTAEVRAANTRLWRATAAKDAAELEALLAAEFDRTSGDATRSASRAVWLKWVLEQLNVVDHGTDAIDVRVLGNVAAATVKGRWTIISRGERSSEPWELRDIWVRKPNRWQLVRRHVISD